MQQINENFLIHFSRTHGRFACIHVPNEIFKILRDNVEEPKRRSFAFNYMVLTGLLYKYAHFSDGNGRHVGRGDIKDMLGYSSKNKYIDKVVSSKDNLMKNGYIKKSRDVPITYEISDDGTFNVKTVNDYRNDVVLYKTLKSTIPTNYTLNYPNFLYSYKSWCGQIEYEGTLLDIDDTFKINIVHFISIITNEGLSEVDKYIYFYLYKKGNGVKKFETPHWIISEDTGFNVKTISTSIKKIKENKLIDVVGGKRYIDKNNSFVSSPNIYEIKNREIFY